MTVCMKVSSGVHSFQEENGPRTLACLHCGELPPTPPPPAINVPLEACIDAIEDVTALLKARFQNLTVEETIKLSNNIVRAVVRRIEGR